VFGWNRSLDAAENLVAMDTAFYIALSILGLLNLMFTCSTMNLNFADHDISNRKGII